MGVKRLIIKFLSIYILKEDDALVMNSFCLFAKSNIEKNILALYNLNDFLIKSVT